MAKAKQGGYAGGRAAFGYGAKRGSHVLTVEPAEAAVVQQVFALRSSGLSLRSVADELNALGLCTAENRTWHAAQVKRVLDRRPLYLGQYSYAGVRTEQGKQERILI